MKKTILAASLASVMSTAAVVMSKAATDVPLVYVNR